MVNIDDMIGDLLPIVSKCMKYAGKKPMLIDAKADKSIKVENQAYCEYLGDSFGVRWFSITYHPSLEQDERALITMLSHELIHVVQYARGDKFDHSLPYSQQPHEIEAYSLEGVVADSYFSLKNPKVTP